MAVLFMFASSLSHSTGVHIGTRWLGRSRSLLAVDLLVAILLRTFYSWLAHHASLLSFLAGVLDVLSAGLFVLGTKVLGAIAGQPGGELAQLGLEARNGFSVHVGLSDHLGKIDDHAAEVLSAIAITWSFAFPIFVFAGLPELADLFA